MNNKMNNKNEQYEVTSALRKAYRKGRLSTEQTARLDAIGFDFIGQKRRNAETTAALVKYLQDRPHECTYAQLAQMFGIEWNQCYSIIHNRKMTGLVKPARDKVNRADVVADYDAGASLKELSKRYGVGQDYIRVILRKSNRTLPRFLNDRKLAEIRRLRESGKSIKEIAAVVEREPHTVTKALREMGMSTGRGHLPKEVVAEAERLIRNGDMLYTEIAEHLGMSKSNVHRIAKSIGVKSNFQNKKRTRCIETGEVFPSTLDAQRSLCPNSTSGSRVSAAIRSGKTYHGYHWEYVDSDTVQEGKEDAD